MTELTGTVTCSYVYLHTNMVTPGSSQIHSVALHNSSYVHSHAHRFLYSNIFTLLQDHLHNKITDSVLIYPHYMRPETQQLPIRWSRFHRPFFPPFPFLSILYMSPLLGRNLMKFGITLTSFLSLSYTYNTCVLM